MKTVKIIHVGGGWYHIVMSGNLVAMARGKAEAHLKATDFELKHKPTPSLDLMDSYLRGQIGDGQ